MSVSRTRPSDRRASAREFGVRHRQVVESGTLLTIVVSTILLLTREVDLEHAEVSLGVLIGGVALWTALCYAVVRRIACLLVGYVAPVDNDRDLGVDHAELTCAVDRAYRRRVAASSGRLHTHYTAALVSGGANGVIALVLCEREPLGHQRVIHHQIFEVDEDVTPERMSEILLKLDGLRVRARVREERSLRELQQEMDARPTRPGRGRRGLTDEATRRSRMVARQTRQIQELAEGR